VGKKKMGEMKIEEMDDENEFLGGMTERKFYARLNFLRHNGGHR
jgi:hypothetical protein